ncbi:hypothetical protein ZEAMMB73_Zm00001d037546 [Zea mays]|uniref:Uncharacterized protein n=1 Tax=Zea mays TaxID=4577 RepID=A0A1D6LYW1_MAIZE|nr:hypothetical protein ZEAMMB73_Zm00001d037546 [Zea mays]
MEEEQKEKKRKKGNGKRRRGRSPGQPASPYAHSVSLSLPRLSCCFPSPPFQPRLPSLPQIWLPLAPIRPPLPLISPPLPPESSICRLQPRFGRRWPDSAPPLFIPSVLLLI